MKQPFSVPEGYFDTLNSRIMANIPAETPENVAQKPARRKRLNTLLWSSVAGVAACVLVVVGISLHQSDLSGLDKDTAYNAETAYAADYGGDNYGNEMAEYAMIDNYDIYTYISE